MAASTAAGVVEEEKHVVVQGRNSMEIMLFGKYFLDHFAVILWATS